jgi:hypothetical protein
MSDLHSADTTHCLECGISILPDESRHETEEGAFCSPCFERLKYEVETIVAKQGEGINYVNAVLGAVLGGLAGAVVWWGFTVVTKISFGLVAIVIGFAVGRGILMFTNGRRSRSLQGIAVAVAAVAYGFASYLVNRTFLIRALADSPEYAGAEYSLPILASPELMLTVIRLNFGLMDVVFLAIVIWEAFKIPAPFRLAD